MSLFTIRLASSTYDAAHLYVAHAKGQPQAQFPIPTAATTFEVVISGKVYTVAGVALQRWIEQRRGEWKGPKGSAVQPATGPFPSSDTQ